ncbi:MAG: ArsR/SmtB family transcription factor [Candidatus Hodarchaeales archaeon]|jgi:DNA-binding transcriptional ArsR family regulator
MEEKLDHRIAEILKLLSDPTRRKILSFISNDSLNPQELADKLGFSRPAVEKHLKLLLANYICERTVEPFPAPHYVYYVSNPGLELMDVVTSAAITFFQSMDGIVSAEIDQIERDFLLERISRKEYDSRKLLLRTRQKELEAMQLTRIWVEEAKKLVNEYRERKFQE